MRLNVNVKNKITEYIIYYFAIKCNFSFAVSLTTQNLLCIVKILHIKIFTDLNSENRCQAPERCLCLKFGHI